VMHAPKPFFRLMQECLRLTIGRNEFKRIHRVISNRKRRPLGRPPLPTIGN
jgi:hypothetical protein